MRMRPQPSTHFPPLWALAWSIEWVLTGLSLSLQWQQARRGREGRGGDDDNNTGANTNSTSTSTTNTEQDDDRDKGETTMPTAPDPSTTSNCSKGGKLLCMMGEEGVTTWLPCLWATGHRLACSIALEAWGRAPSIWNPLLWALAHRVGLSTC